MYRPNEAKVLALIAPGDRVLDVGGGAGSCLGATDLIGPRSAGPGTADRWIQRDLCDRTPWPFEDQSIDFCICSRVLEGIRDPVWVCQEMIRVAKRGYIEVTSRLAESSRGQEPGVPVGYAGHRWLVEVRLPKILFTPKDGFLYGDGRLSFPASFAASLPEERRMSWFFWEDEFRYEENPAAAREELRAFRRRHLAEESLEGTLEEVQAQNEILRDQLDRYEHPSALTFKIARRLQHASRRHPRLSASVKRVLKAIA